MLAEVDDGEVRVLDVDDALEGVNMGFVFSDSGELSGRDSLAESTLIGPEHIGMIMAAAGAKGVGKVGYADTVVVGAQEVVDEMLLEIAELVKGGDVGTVFAFHGEVVAVVDREIGEVDVLEIFFAVFVGNSDALTCVDNCAMISVDGVFAQTDCSLLEVVLSNVLVFNILVCTVKDEGGEGIDFFSVVFVVG